MGGEFILYYSFAAVKGTLHIWLHIMQIVAYAAYVCAYEYAPTTVIEADWGW